MRREVRSGAVLALMLTALVVSACGGGGPDREPPAPRGSSGKVSDSGPRPPERGRWHALPADPPGLTAAQRDALERLETLPYFAGSRPAPSRTGVTRLIEARVQPGLNLFNSGHGPEAFLTDLKGEVLHRWTYPIDRLWPDEERVHQSSYWRRVTWLPDGDILAVFEGIGLIVLEKDSRLRWAFKDTVHHQAVVGLDETIWTLTRKHHVLRRINPDQPVHEDFLTRLTPQGELLEKISLLEAFENSSYRHLLEGMKREGDIFHTNSIEVLDGRFRGRAEWLKRGNLLLSVLFLDTICVVDPDQKKVVWALKGEGTPSFQGPHDPRVLPNGRLLLFDNWGRNGKSKVIEFDPLNLREVWRYPHDSESEFATPTCGTSQRLANGNTLITESDRGRAFEVSPEGDIVWEFFNPHRAGPKQELIATLFEVRRVPRGYFSW